MACPKISVILPAYNVAEYLPRALDSLIHQTFQDFEVFMVDDGSSDDTGRICDQYAQRDSRFTALHQHNAGAPAARNSAIPHAKGTYLYFMDADDWAESEMLAEMIALAEDTQAELVVTGFCIDTESANGRVFRQTISPEAAQYGDARAFRKAATALFDANLLYSPWNKLFLTQRIQRLNLRFRNTRWDDFPFNLDYIRDVSRVTVSSAARYHFVRARADSETSRYFPEMFEKREEEHRWMVELYKYWGLESDPQAREFLARRYIERVFGVIENTTCAACTLNRREKCRAIKRFLASPSVDWSLRYAKPHTLMMKIMLIPVRMRSSRLTYLLGCFISYVKAHSTGLFARLKARR